MLSFRSKITKAVLGYFVLHEDAQMYVNEIARRLKLDSGNVTRKLQELEKFGILTSDHRGMERYYKLNSNFPLLAEYKKIIQKTIGIEHTLRGVLGSLKGVDKAYIFGSYAQEQMDANSDIDLLVIGDFSVIELQKKITPIQKLTDREINTISMTLDEYNKKSNSDPFIKSLKTKPRIKLV